MNCLCLTVDYKAVVFTLEIHTGKKAKAPILEVRLCETTLSNSLLAPDLRPMQSIEPVVQSSLTD